MAQRRAKEISIRIAPLPLSRAGAAAIAALALLTSPLATADEFDWLYFPMYVGDTAHAVHLKSLTFRPDGLLAAATRYPRTSDDWTGPESKAGWYNYDERLIDCETGYFVETASSLLDHDNNKLTSRAGTREEQVKRLEAQLQKRQKWPNNGDVFLACAAASDSAFKRQRAAAAAKVQPLFSDRSIIEVLGADTEALGQLRQMRYDFSRIAKKPAAPAAELFDDMRAQYTAWRKRFNVGYIAALPDPAADAAALAKAHSAIEETGARNVTIERIRGPVIDFTYPSERLALQGTDGLDTSRIDCAARIAVPIAQRTRKGQQLGGTVPLKVKAVLPEIEQAYGEQDEGGMDATAANLCSLVASVRSGRTGEASENAPLPYGLTPDALAAQPTPEAMLLAIRAASRKAH
ncbi:MAG: hypothetical protein ACLGI6_03740 [Gammaproteobacteria bacterium]